MPLDRTLIKSGPALLTWQNAKIYFRGGLTIAEEKTTIDLEADVMSVPDARMGDRLVTFSGVPVGAWKDLAVLFALASAPIGTRLHGAADSAATIHFLDGDLFTYHNAALINIPDLIFSAVKTLLGEVQFEARTKKATAASAANSLFTRTNTPFTDASFDSAEILTQVYTYNFGAAPWDDIQTADGMKVMGTPVWRDILDDSAGVIERELTGLSFSSSFTPLGIAQADIDSRLALQNNAAAVRGASMSGIAEDLIITGPGVFVKQRGGFLRSSSMKAARDANRHDTHEIVSTLNLLAGTQQAGLVVATEDPDA